MVACDLNVFDCMIKYIVNTGISKVLNQVIRYSDYRISIL